MEIIQKKVSAKRYREDVTRQIPRETKNHQKISKTEQNWKVHKQGGGSTSQDWNTGVMWKYPIKKKPISSVVARCCSTIVRIITTTESWTSQLVRTYRISAFSSTCAFACLRRLYVPASTCAPVTACVLYVCIYTFGLSPHCTWSAASGAHL